MDYQKAKAISAEFLEYLTPICIRVEVVGSVKREDDLALNVGCHDVEFLLIQKPGAPRPMFGRPTNIYMSYLDEMLADLEYRGRLRQANDRKDGQKYKKRVLLGTGELNDFCVEFFIVNPDTWGWQSLIRTGPSEFSHRAVTNQRLGGLLPDHLQYLRGESQVMDTRTNEIVQCPNEQDVFVLLGLDWLPPNIRWQYASWPDKRLE